ncbi:MAG TPA: nitrilase-related carbon-nitrogen hydrolase, partial [Bacteroidales bacterium]|nr:nitrilase-related carbon-nitrogen hydrolase [Bacteroidales bacterium]
RIGMQICFDWMFPEPWRILAMQDADLIAHPSNLVLPFAQQVIPAYALVNRVFILTANRTGSENGVSFTGRSLIAGPDGRLLAQATEQADGMIQATLAPEEARNKMITFSNHAFRDRVPSLYGPLTEDTQRIEPF